MNTKETLEDLIIDPRRYTARLDLPDPASIKIYDTTLRDGEQMPGVAMSPEQKFLIARELSALGVHIVDLGFPASSQSELQALELVMKGKASGEIRADLDVLVMCRSTQADIDLTLKTIESIGCGPGDVTFLVFTSSSNLHCKYKLGPMLMRREKLDPKDLADTPLAFFHEANKRMVVDTIRYMRSRGITRIEFGAEDSSRTPVEQLIDLARVAIDAGAMRYVFADTTGSLTPEATRFYCRALGEALPTVDRVTHFHNDFDLATANAIEGVLSGFPIFTATMNGLGERAGNVPMHAMLVALKYLYDLEVPGFQYDRLCYARRVVEDITGIPVQPNEPVIGYNVFLHESGIHTHGMSISQHMYEPILAEAVGGANRFVYGKHSGSHSLRELLVRHEREIGCQVTDEFVGQVLSDVKRLREDLIARPATAEAIAEYYANLEKLGMSEEQVVEIARVAAGRRQYA